MYGITVSHKYRVPANFCARGMVFNCSNIKRSFEKSVKFFNFRMTSRFFRLSNDL